jgi:hypothetical protein
MVVVTLEEVSVAAEATLEAVVPQGIGDETSYKGRKIFY